MIFSNKQVTTTKQPSQIREWLNAIFSTVIFVSLFQWLVLARFAIPSSSMEKTLLTGDHIVVSKLHYGARIPRTPLKIPLTHQTIGSTGIPSYLDWIQLPQYRLPHFSQVQRGDKVVFNYPMELDKPVDIRTYYIKRCVALPGDELQIKDGQVYINEDPQPQYPGLQYCYLLKTSLQLPQHFFKKYAINEYGSAPTGYLILTTSSTAAKLAQIQGIEEVKQVIKTVGEAEESFFCASGTAIPWNIDQLGPLVVPQKGATIPINQKTLAQYEWVITYYEGHRDVKIDNDQLWVNGQQLATYTFQQDYYFMMGDNRYNSRDSRFWGFVPQDHIVGKAVLTLFSLDYDQPWPWKIRWNRFLRPI